MMSSLVDRESMMGSTAGSYQDKVCARRATNGVCVRARVRKRCAEVLVQAHSKNVASRSTCAPGTADSDSMN